MDEDKYIKLSDTVKVRGFVIKQFKEIAEDVSRYSKDPNTKVGAVLYESNTADNIVGYNTLPKGIELSEERWSKREGDYFDTKYPWIIHAEVDAISRWDRYKFYAESSLENCFLLVTLYPCHQCAKLIAANRIPVVIYLDDKYEGTPDRIVAEKILTSAGVKVYKYSDIIEEL